MWTVGLTEEKQVAFSNPSNVVETKPYPRTDEKNPLSVDISTRLRFSNVILVQFAELCASSLCM